MALDSATSAASSITSTSARMNGSWTQDTASCCDAPPCSYAQRFYYGTSSPPGTLVSAGSVCDAGYCDGGANSYNYTITGLTSDETYYFRASIATSSLGGACDGGCGGTCAGSDNGGILSFKTCGASPSLGTPSNGTPGETSVTVQITVDPVINESSATIIAEYKLDTEPTTWTTGGSRSCANGSHVEQFTFTGLTSGALYDYRFRLTRAVSCGTTSSTSAEGAFTTAASSIPIDMAEVLTLTDAAVVAITGAAAVATEAVGIDEVVELQLVTTDEETFVGVWFYHLPTRSYWFWNFDNFTAAINDTDGNDRSRLFVALGSKVYIADDEEYFFDDRDQRRPIADATGSEIELSLVPRAVDLGGGYGRLTGVEAKWGAPPNIPDPLGLVDIGLLSDVYPKKPVPPNARRVLAERRVPVAPDHHGIDEWRRYALPRVAPTNVIGTRFSWPTGTHPKRVAPVEIESIKLNITRSARRRGRV